MQALLADIGGTNTRLGLYDLAARTLVAVHVVPTRADESFAHAARRFLEEADLARVDIAVVAAAGPKLGGAITLTNQGWRVAETELAEITGARAHMLLNDFEALAYAVPALPADGTQALGCAVDLKGDASGAVALIGAGTGLGVSGLLPAQADSFERAIAGEGGHISFAPENDREWEITSALRARFGHVSAERIASGLGLVDSYTAICELCGRAVGEVDAAAIAAKAAAGEAEAAEAMQLFAAALGSAAGSVALAFGATGGVYVAGGILPKWGHAFRADIFRARFEGKGRFKEYLSRIPTRLVTADLAAFAGLQRVATRLAVQLFEGD